MPEGEKTGVASGPARGGPVFFDPRHRRVLVLKVIAAVAAVILSVWTGIFAVGLYFYDLLPERTRLELIAGSASTEEPPLPAAPACPGVPLAGDALLPGAEGIATAAYLRVWPDSGLVTMENRCGLLGGIVAEWVTADPVRGEVAWLDDAGGARALVAVARRAPGTRLDLVAGLPLPSVYSPDAAVLEDAAARADLIAALKRTVAGGGFDGICLRPYRFDASHLDGLRALMAELDAALPPGVDSCLVAEAEGPLWRDAPLAGSVDGVIVQMFTEPDRGAPPGPLAPQAWFEALLAEATGTVGAERLRVALGSFGYRWTEAQALPVVVSYAEAMRLASRHGARIALDSGSLNTRITFEDEAGRASEIWLLDAASLHNQLLALRGQGIAGAVLWAAGMEDPGAWTLMSDTATPPRAAEVETVELPYQVGYEGTGPFRRVAESDRPGLRHFFVDPESGLVVGQVYEVLPRPYTVERFGNLDRKVVSLTFDDGPDPRHTADLLDLFQREDVPATFFLIGSNMLIAPDLVRRMMDEGHEIGSHTFFHPEHSDLGPVRTQLELNAVQRLLAAITGRTTYLFRTPYGRSEGPLTADEALPQSLIETEGYIVAGADIVPPDWEGLTAEEIVDYAMAQIDGDNGQVIVLHDAGGDRTATVEAVAILIGRLRAQGYEFVPLSAFLGVTPEEIMPPARDWRTDVDSVSFSGLVWGGRALVWIFWGAVAFGVSRSLFVLVLALLRRPHRVVEDAPLPAVTVAIPALNEAAVIARSVAAALASDHPDLEVIVVDDGSTDGTARIVEAAFGGHPRVRLIRQPNGGKWSALNAAFRAATTEVIVAVDADTQLDPAAARLLARHFADGSVGAMAGNVKVGNRTGLLPRLQALEYITAQNVDRRAAERLNAMLVVPGSIGAWRVAAVREAGWYSGDTITEDADLTVSVLRAGYRVGFEPRALSWTEVPEGVAPLLRQRLRWVFGMMQTAWKHRGAARTARGVGLFAIPDLWLTGIALSLLAPVVDLVLLAVIAEAAFAVLEGRPLMQPEVSAAIVAGWLALPAFDLLVAMTAFGFERHERWRLLLLIPLQRLIYRPLLYVTVYRAVARALAGHLAAWGRLVRLGTVKPVG